MSTQSTILWRDGGSNPTPTHCKSIEIREITPEMASSYNKEWHSRLPRIPVSNIFRNTHYVCYGFFLGNLLVGVAIWTSPVAQNRFKNGKEILELRRMALSPKCPKNTASRTLSVMVKKIKNKFPEIKKLISYQDTSVHKGTIYKASGWKDASKTPFMDWDTEERKRNPYQSNSEKVRWELNVGG